MLEKLIPGNHQDPPGRNKMGMFFHLVPLKIARPQSIKTPYEIQQIY